MADTYDLALVQSARFRRGFRVAFDGVAIDWAAFEVRAQIRRKEATSADLVLDLSPMLAIDDTDSTLLWLDIPATATAALDSGALRRGGHWDLFRWPQGQPEAAQLAVQGAVTMDPATTDTRGA